MSDTTTPAARPTEAASDPAPEEKPRRGSGCATALGIVLILVGALALAVNVHGARLLVVLVDLIPVASVWWPVVLIAWGLGKIVQRFVTGRARFGFFEILLLLFVLFVGLGLSLGRQIVERWGVADRVHEVHRWVREQVNPVPQHAFATELEAPLPPEITDLVVELDAGGIVVEASSPPRAEASETEAGGADASATNLETREVEEAPRVARITLRKRIWAATPALAERRADEARLVVSPGGDRTEDSREGRRLRVTVVDEGESDAAFDLVLEVPPDVSVSAVTGRGPVRVEGAFAAVTAEGSHGPVEVRGAAGAAHLAGRDGAIVADDIAGAVTVRAHRAVVDVAAAGDAVSVDSHGGPVRIAGAAGVVAVEAVGPTGVIAIEDAAKAVQVNSRFLPVTLRRIGGAAKVAASFGPVVVERVLGPVEIRSERALIEVRDAEGAVDLDAGSGDVIVEQVAGALTVVTGGGDLFARGLGGAAVLSVGDGMASVETFARALRLSGGDGDLRVSTSGVGGSISVSSRGGDIHLELPTAGSFQLAVRAEPEDVTSHFELESSADDSRLVASVGGGGPPVLATTEGGEILVVGISGGEPPRGASSGRITTPEDPQEKP